MTPEPRQSLTIQIDNLTEPQSLAIQDMLAMWIHLGRIGGSRVVSFYADGDGNFHPQITVNPNGLWDNFFTPTQYGTKEQIRARWKKDDSYLIDFDEIAGQLRKRDRPKCDVHDHLEPDGHCSCPHKCDSCGTQYKGNNHSKDDCIKVLKDTVKASFGNFQEDAAVIRKASNTIETKDAVDSMFDEAAAPCENKRKDCDD